MTPRLAAAALAAPSALWAACLSTPPYDPPGGALSYAADGTGGTISAPDLALHFASGPAFHFPDALTVDGANLIGRDATQPCDGEDGVGLMISPTPRISAVTGAPLTLNQLTPTLRGPAAVQVRLDWSSQFTCAGNRPAGASTYTVFPDARIVRHDTLGDQHVGEFSAAACACSAASPADGFKVSSYWALAPAAFRTIYVLGDTIDPQPLPSDPLAPFFDTNFYVACLDAGSYQVGVAWSRSDAITGNPKVFADTAQVVFSRERTGGLVSTLDPLDWATNDALFVGRAGCSKLVVRGAEHAMPWPISINGAMTGIVPSVVDGMYGGDPGDGSAPGAAVAPGSITLAPSETKLGQNALLDSFAVWLRFSSAVDGVRASLAGKAGQWYVVQRVSATSWILWFRDPLTAGQRISINTF